MLHAGRVLGRPVMNATVSRATIICGPQCLRSHNARVLVRLQAVQVSMSQVKVCCEARSW